MGLNGACRSYRFGDGGHAKSSMGPKRWLKVSFFAEKPMLEGGSVATYGIHSPSSDCNFRLQQFVRIVGTKGAYQIPQSGTEGYSACSVGS